MSPVVMVCVFYVLQSAGRVVTGQGVTRHVRSVSMDSAIPSQAHATAPVDGRDRCVILVRPEELRHYIILSTGP